MIEKKEVCGDCVYRRSEGACTALPPQVVPVAIVPPKQSIVTGSGQEMPLAVQLAIALPSVQLDGAVCSLYTKKEEEEAVGEPAEK